MTDIKFISHTIDDKIVKDSINAIHNNSDLILIGGMAVQAFFKNKFSNKTRKLKRNTSDIDTLSASRYTTENFKEKVAAPITNELISKGYETYTKKGRYAFEINVTAENGDSILIHSNRYSQQFYEREKDKLRRTKEKAREIKLDGIEALVEAPEEIISAKLDRLISYYTQYSVVPRKIDLGDLEKEKEFIEQKREELYFDYDNLTKKRLASLRSHKDAYDLIILDMSTELDPNYFVEVAYDWNIPQRLNKDKRLKNDIFSISPEIVRQTIELDCCVSA